MISIEGETNGGPDSEPSPAPYGEDYWQVRPIAEQWSSPWFEGQMIADRWKPQSPRRKQSGGRGGWERGGLMGGGQSAVLATRRMKARHDVSLTQRAHPHLPWP